MNRFDYVRAGTVAEAVQAFGAGARFIAGGTNLIDLMKYEVEKPGRLIDITRLPLDRIEAHGDGLRIGALVTNAKVAYDDQVARPLPAPAQRHPGRRLGAAAQRRLHGRATCCSGPAATISTTWPRPATSARRAPAARRSAG